MLGNDKTFVVDTEMINLIRSCISNDFTKGSLTSFLVETIDGHKRIVATDTWRMVVIDFGTNSTFSSLEELKDGLYRIVQVTKNAKGTSAVRVCPVDSRFPNYKRTIPENNPQLYVSSKLGIYRSFIEKEEKHARLQIQGGFCGDVNLLPSAMEDFTVYRHVRIIPKDGNREIYSFVHKTYNIYYLMIGMEKR